MFKAFIIDDDIISVDVTYAMFPWDELNITQIEKIYSPTGLVEKILVQKPHIVFIDIEMGNVSGLDIIEECKNKGSESLFVIISGHDNFDYAHAAVNLGAIYYLLKPIDSEDINALSKKLKRVLKSNHSENEISIHLSYKDSFNSYLIPRLKGGSFRFIICNLSLEQENNIQNVLKSSVFDTYRIGKSKYLFIISNYGLNPDIIKELNHFAYENQVFCGMSSVFTTNDNLYEHFNRTNQLSYHYFLSSRGQLLIDPVNSDTTILKNILDNLYQALDEKNLKAIENILNKLPMIFTMQNYTMWHVKWFYNAVILRISILNNQGHNFPLSQMDEEELSAQFQNFSVLCSTLLSYLTGTLEPDIAPDENTSKLWKNILEYIEKNYDKKIQARNVCSELYISERTFYYLFKANTKETFVEYLTHFRIEKAKQLLLLTNKPISEIAESIGIKDHYYFNKIFKTHTGVTPAKFRDKGGSSNNAEQAKN